MAILSGLTAFRADTAGVATADGPAFSVKGRLRLGVIRCWCSRCSSRCSGGCGTSRSSAATTYQAQAADQSVREIVVQPARGLIVDDMGRPLVANRTSWVVTVDRTLLQQAGRRRSRSACCAASPARSTSPTRRSATRTLLCGEPGSVAGTCWNGSPYQPVPIAEDIPQQTALSIMEQNEDFPAVLVEAQNVRAYPSPYGINAAHLLGYLSPITEAELDQAEEDDDESVHGASVVGRAGLEKEYDEYLRGFPGYKQVAVDSMGRVLGDSGEVAGPRGRHAGHLDRRPGAGRRRAAARADDQDRPRHRRHGDRPQLRRRLRARRS